MTDKPLQPKVRSRTLVPERALNPQTREEGLPSPFLGSEANGMNHPHRDQIRQQSLRVDVTESSKGEREIPRVVEGALGGESWPVQQAPRSGSAPTSKVPENERSHRLFTSNYGNRRDPEHTGSEHTSPIAHKRTSGSQSVNS